MLKSANVGLIQVCPHGPYLTEVSLEAGDYTSFQWHPARLSSLPHGLWSLTPALNPNSDVFY